MSNGNSNNDALVLERHLNTTPEKAFEAWTKPEKMKQWFGPTGSLVFDIYLFSDC